MAVKLPDTLVPMADFPSAFAKDVQFTDGENLQDKLDKGKLGSSSGGTGLTEEQANNIEKIPSIEGIVTSNSQAIENKADKDHEHTEYLKEIPDEYVTETELETKGYLTEHQDISNLQPKTDDSLTTTDKTIVGAINELNNKQQLTEITLTSIEDLSNIEVGEYDATIASSCELIKSGIYHVVKTSDTDIVLTSVDGNILSFYNPPWLPTWVEDQDKCFPQAYKYTLTDLSVLDSFGRGYFDAYIESSLSDGLVDSGIYSVYNSGGSITFTSMGGVSYKYNKTGGAWTLETKGNFVTEAFVTNAIANAQLGDKEVDLSGYATVDALNLKADLTHTHDQYLTEVPDEYITETELTAKGYLTEHQDISNLALKSEIPDVSSFITSDDLPTVPTKVSDLENDSNFVTNSKMLEAIANAQLGNGEGSDMAGLILDTEVRLDKTYSSSKIHSDIQQCLEDSKTYTLEEFGKKIGASYEVVTSIDDMVSQDRLYLLKSGNNYDIYIVDVDNVPVVIGDTSIDLSGYVTKTEIDNNFLKKVDADSKYATITTVGDKIDKDMIVTVLWDTSTDEQVPSALLTKTEFDKVNESISTVNANLGELCNKKIYCGEAKGTVVDGVISVRNPIGKAGNAIATMQYSSGSPRGYSVTTQVTSSALNFYFRWHRESDDTEAYPPDGTEIAISYMIFY